MVTRITLLLVMLLALATTVSAQRTSDVKDLQYAKKILQLRSMQLDSIIATINASSTHRMSPSAKAVYDFVVGYVDTAATGGGGGISDGDKGDITVSSSGAVWTIDTGAISTHKVVDGAITGAKIAQDGATSGQVLKWDGATWSPDDDANTTYTGGTGIDVTGTVITNTGDTDASNDITTSTSAGGDLNGTYPDPTVDGLQGRAVSATAPGSGEVLKWNGSAWAPAADNDTGDDWGTQVVETTARISGDGTTGTELDIAQQGATSGQVLKWNGSAWAPDDDAGTTYTGGTGIDVTGTVITNTGDTDASNDITTSTSAGGDLNGTYPDPTVDGLQGRAVSATAPGSGEVLKWNGSAWAPAADNDTGDDWGTQVVETTARISGDGTTGTELDIAQQGATSGQVLKWNGSAWAPDDDANTTYTGGTGIDVTGTTISNTGDTNAADDITTSTSAGGDLSGTYPDPTIATGAVTPSKTSGFTANTVIHADGSGVLQGSSDFKYETNTLRLNNSALDTLLLFSYNHSDPFGLERLTDPYNGTTVAYRFGGLNSRRVFLKAYGFYMEAPFYQSEAAGIGFGGNTGLFRLNTNGDYYTATLTGDNQTTNRNVTWLFQSGGGATGKGNPVIFQHQFSNNDTLCNSFEFLARNTASGGVTHPDSTLFRVGNWDRGTALNILQRGDIGIKTRSPLYTLDVNATDGIRLPRGNTAERPASTPAGVLRFNTDSTALEVGTGSEWVKLGSGGGGGGADGNGIYDGSDTIPSNTTATLTDWVQFGSGIRIDNNSMDNQVPFTIGNSLQPITFGGAAGTATLGGSFGGVIVGGSSGSVQIYSSNAVGGGVKIYNAGSNASSYINLGGDFSWNSAGKRYLAKMTLGTIDNDSDADIVLLGATHLINQTGTATGDISAIEISPTVTSLLGNYYGVDIGINDINAYGIYQSGLLTNNYLSGDVGIGAGTTTPGAKLDVISDGTTSGTYAFQVANSNDSILVSVRDDRKIGINKVDAAEAVDINGQVRADAIDLRAWSGGSNTNTGQVQYEDPASGASEFLSFGAGERRFPVLPHSIQLQAVDYNTDWTTGRTKAFYTVPARFDGWKISKVYLHVSTIGSTTGNTIEIERGGSALTTITINEAVETATLDTTINTDDIITFDITGTGATASKGLFVEIELRYQ